MAAVVDTIDFDAVWEEITERLEAEALQRTKPPLVRIWDGNWILVGQVARSYAGSFQEIDSETGIGTIDLPEEYYITKWAVDSDNRTGAVHITVDKDGVRWGGRMDDFEVDTDADGKTIIRLIFKHDYEEFKHLPCWSNPFLPAEFQFPRLWFAFGPTKWALKLTLLVNIMRLESSLWMLPDDPLDLAEWFDFDQSTWSMAVMPLSIEDDNSPTGVVYSRFKNFHDVAKQQLADGQLTPTLRRFLDGDPPPWPGANLRHGCLVIDIVDKSGWTTGTSFGGNLFTGLERALIDIADDGLTQGIDVIDDPSFFPPEYSQPGWKQTLPAVPAIVYREGAHNGVVSSKFTGHCAKAVQWTTGGHSAPGVNEAIGAAIEMAGNLTALIPAVGVPIGGALDDILKPLYTDVVASFMSWKDPVLAQHLGFSHYKEDWADGADRAYDLSALVSLRAARYAGRECFSHTLEVGDGRPWIIGQQGYGNFYVGDRIADEIKGLPRGKLFVDRVSQATISWDEDKPVNWKLNIGVREQKDPAVKALEDLQNVMGMVRDLGVL